MARFFLDDETKPDLSAPLTPVQYLEQGIWVKRDDYFVRSGVRGGKARTCAVLAQGARGLVTSGSRTSPQTNIVAHIGQSLGVPVRIHTPTGELSPELLDAQACGAEIIQHRAGYTSVITARAYADAKARGYTEIPFALECPEAIRQTRSQVRNVPKAVGRIVMPVGGGMSFCGVLWGLQDAGLDIPVLGISVGADPRKRIREYAPGAGRWQLGGTGTEYHAPAKDCMFEGINLDPFYEAKVVPFLQPGDLFWIVGIRRTAEVV